MYEIRKLLIPGSQKRILTRIMRGAPGTGALCNPGKVVTNIKFIIS